MKYAAKYVSMHVHVWIRHDFGGHCRILDALLLMVPWLYCMRRSTCLVSVPCTAYTMVR